MEELILAETSSRGIKSSERLRNDGQPHDLIRAVTFGNDQPSGAQFLKLCCDNRPQHIQAIG